MRGDSHVRFWESPGCDSLGPLNLVRAVREFTDSRTALLPIFARRC
jgi:hypothetical protein